MTYQIEVQRIVDGIRTAKTIAIEGPAGATQGQANVACSLWLLSVDCPSELVGYEVAR